MKYLSKEQLFLKWNVDLMKFKPRKIDVKWLGDDDGLVKINDDLPPWWFWVVLGAGGLFISSLAIITALGVLGLI